MRTTTRFKTNHERPNNVLRGGSDIRKEPLRNAKVLVTIDRTFNPLIHIMVPNPNGKGHIQKLR